MLHLTSLGASVGARGAAVVGSVVLHAALLVTTLGHPTAARGKDAPEAIDVELAPASEAQVDLAPPEEPPHAHASPEFPHHTHPYPVPPSHDWTPHDPNLVHVFAPAAAHPEPAPPVAPAPALTSDAEMPHFVMAVGTGGEPGVESRRAAEPQRSGDGEDGTAVREQAVTTRARLASGGAPAYPEEARAASIEADVPLEIVVAPDGTVDDARVLRPAGHGLDAAALDAVRRYRFTPATKDGRPVHVRMQWLVQFRLR